MQLEGEVSPRGRPGSPAPVPAPARGRNKRARGIPVPGRSAVGSARCPARPPPASRGPALRPRAESGGSAEAAGPWRLAAALTTSERADTCARPREGQAALGSARARRPLSRPSAVAAEAFEA